MTSYMQSEMPPKSSNGSLEKTLLDAGFGAILEQPRFVLYKQEVRDGKTTKVPKQPNGQNAGSTIPETWNTFAVVYAAFVSGGPNFDGLGIILGDVFGSKIVGMDLDHVCDAFTGKFTNAEAEQAVANVKTYGEHSISGTGVHFLFLNQDVPEGYKTRTSATAPFDLEVYESGRYFTLSGDWINGQQLGTDEVSLKGICETYLPTRVEKRAPKITKAKEVKTMGIVSGMRAIEVSDALTLDSRFNALYSGCRPFGNESADDLGLLNLLVKYVGRDAEKVQAAFLASGHFQTKDDYHKQKCVERDDYLQASIKKAIENFFTGYSYDDVGNSDMFVDAYEDQLVFCKEWDSWNYWNGKNWEKKASLHAQELAKDLSDTFRAKAQEYKHSPYAHSTELVKTMTKHS